MEADKGNIDAWEDDEEEEGSVDDSIDAGDYEPIPMQKMKIKLKWYYKDSNENKELKIKYMKMPFSEAIAIVKQETGNIENVVFAIHGYYSNIGENWMSKIKDAFLNQTNDNHNNVILFDWSKCCRHLDYRKSCKNTKPASQILAEFAKELCKAGTRQEDIHYIGHSLGAHLAGFASKEFKVGRITGLDPAGPCFRKFKRVPSERLDKTDADFVDVIHSDTRKSLKRGKPLGYGLSAPIGNVDFYPNHGFWQPISAADYMRYGGSHNVCISIFIDSMTHPHEYLAQSRTINSIHPQIEMGYNAINFKGANGSYFINIDREKMHIIQKRVYSLKARNLRRFSTATMIESDDVIIKSCIPIKPLLKKRTNVSYH